ncbi:MAG: hypothetical protein R3250_00830, partial [Melioribacteraceae bacterium]|nr:hypothetical protein [Melioribacteraceae bacterium]
TLRFFAHLFSVLLIFVVLLLAIGEDFLKLTNLDVMEVLLSLSLLTMLVGLLSAWKWEGIGGILIIAGFALFFLANSYYAKELRLGFFFLLFPLTGLLYLFCCWRDNKGNFFKP